MTIEITQDFSSALLQLQKGRNVLITGRAGTGKSTLLREFINKHTHGRNTLITAPTGVAALNIGGVTIHRGFGFHPALFPDDIKDTDAYRPSKRTVETLQSLDILIIDEISMVRADLFDMIDTALRRIRQNDAPFGGVQLVLVGDLLQLPPVVPNEDMQLFTGHPWTSPYFFSSNCYPLLDLYSIELTTIWRQKDDKFIELLNQVREGEISNDLLSQLNTCVDEKYPEENGWVILTPYRKKAHKINQEKLDNIPGNILYSVAEFKGEAAEKDFPGSVELLYKPGARVMSIINDPGNLFVNGSFGTITNATQDAITVKFDHGPTAEITAHTWEVRRPAMYGERLSSETVGSITQFPVILAWAITIHKSQGKTIPKCYIDLSGGTQIDGQFYVALSRAVDLEHLRINQEVSQKNIRSDGRIIRMIRRGANHGERVEKRVVISFEAVDFRVSQHIVHVHCIIIDNGIIKANFGSWINPNADLGKIGKKYNIPSFGLATSPELGDFWPLLLRQAAGGIIIGDNLGVLERAIRHQEPGLKPSLGLGYDIEELNFRPEGDTPEQRCESIVRAILSGSLTIENGTPVPTPDKNVEGALYIPDWAPREKVILDSDYATDSDLTWSAMSYGPVNPESQAEIQECVDLLSSWAESRGGWNDGWHNEISERSRRLTAQEVLIPSVTQNKVDLRSLIVPGTRVAFTGTIIINGMEFESRGDNIESLCREANIVYKNQVSKTRCDLLVAADPSSMSRKAKNAREFGKPIISSTQFETWYNSIRADQTSTLVSSNSGPSELSQTISESIDIDNALTETNVDQLEPLFPAIEFSNADEVLIAGTRVAFSGAIVIDGTLIAHGESLQHFCAEVGLIYKNTISRTKSDVLVTANVGSETNKIRLAKKYGKHIISVDDFSKWAHNYRTLNSPHSVDEAEANMATSDFIDDTASTTVDEANIELTNNANLAAYPQDLHASDFALQRSQKEVTICSEPSGHSRSYNEISKNDFLRALFGSSKSSALQTPHLLASDSIEPFMLGTSAWICKDQIDFLDKISQGHNPFGLKKKSAKDSALKFLISIALWFTLMVIGGALVGSGQDGIGGTLIVFAMLITLAALFYIAQSLVRLIKKPSWNVAKSISTIEDKLGCPVDQKLAIFYIDINRLSPLHQEILRSMQSLYSDAATHGMPISTQQWRELTAAALQSADIYLQSGSLDAATMVGDQIKIFRPQH
ncbi:AAA family ATPase [Corynebacterium durum]|uniref:AAA family ATPase n=1 Tax=Corynebacterium durum TaxID=61592 RepID=UPI0028E9134A|nr:AAA family ATPase [Corynebacterium durum]